VQLVARVEGYLEAYHFKDGARVRRGDLLFTIQQDQYKAQLRPSGSASSGTTGRALARQNRITRYAELLKKNAASEVDVDNWRFQRSRRQRRCSPPQAQVEIAKLNLSYTEIRAPFDGA